MVARLFPIGSQLAAIGGADNSRTSKALHVHEYSPTLIAAAQMVGDGLILTTLSYLSLSIFIGAKAHVEYLPYAGSTLFMTFVLILAFARSDVYNVFEEFITVTILTS